MAITDGKNGLYFTVGSNTLHGLSKVDEVYSAIGSGDCLLTGIIAGHVFQKANLEIVNLGAACGATNCIRPERRMIYKGDVKGFLNKTE